MIRLKKGDVVWYVGSTPEQVRWGNNDAPTMLKTQTQYTIKEVESHTWHTKVILEEYPDKSFNSVSFRIV